MYPEYKDYYRILGVEKASTQEEIKKAFRKLARQYHPDKVQDEGKRAESEEKIREINEAYEVLGDPAKRAKYDELGANWQQATASGGSQGWGDEFQSRRGPGPGGGSYEFHFGGTGFSDFFEKYFGGYEGGFDFRSGQEGPFTYESSRPNARQGHDLEAEIMVTLDEVCQATTRRISFTKIDPQSGKESSHSYNVRIPLGVREGQRLRVSGQGGAGVGGGPAGDLFLRVRYAKHPDFKVKGSDLYYELPLTPWEAVLGTKVKIPTLKSAVALTIRAGTQSGQQQRLRGMGLPSKDGSPGDLYVEIVIKVPESVSGEEKRLWEELQQSSTFNPRKSP